MPGTYQAGEPGENTNAVADANYDAPVDENLEGMESGDEGTDESEGPYGADETETGVEDETAEQGDGDETVGQDERRKFQLVIDRQGNELGVLRKFVGEILGRMNKAGIGGPTAEDWANNPDEAAKTDQDMRRQQEDLELESRRAEIRTAITRLHPNFEALIPDMVQFLKEDGAPEEYIKSFKANPYDLDVTTAHLLAKNAELNRRLKGTAKAAKPNGMDIRKMTPTNDRSGKAAEPSRGPINLATLEKLMNDEDALEKALSTMSKKDLDGLIEAQKKRSRQRR
jgi:hypothetical protein